MKKKHMTKYRLKMILVYCVMVIIVVFLTSLAFTLDAQQQDVDEKEALLNLLTEQMLSNFDSAAEFIQSQLFHMISDHKIGNMLYELRVLSPDMENYHQKSQELILAINKSITAETYYDSIYFQSDYGTSYVSYTSYDDFRRDAQQLLSVEKYSQNTYGRTNWVRMQNNNLYIIQDIYSFSPLRHVGKAVARLREGMLVNLNSYNQMLNCSIIFFDSQNNVLYIEGDALPAIEAAAKQVVTQRQPNIDVNGQTYITSIYTNDAHTIVGMLPSSDIYSVFHLLKRSGIQVAIISIVFGIIMVMISTNQLTRQVGILAKYMDKMADGGVGVMVPVRSNDELGHLAIHFNQMTCQIRALLTRVLEEQQRKSKIEYEILDYRYRSLQSQINPHFIYNAMEAVNAMAKIDGNDDICNMIQHISAFFRQNTQNMQKRFIPIRQEFDSLQEYAHIYRYIQGDMLRTHFHFDENVGNALLPTMILQPILENALIHGAQSANGFAVVSVCAYATETQWLHIEICDNGNGMPQEVVDLVLSSEAAVAKTQNSDSTGIGMRNVRDRLALIYEDKASITIDSKLGGGTKVSIRIPMAYGDAQ